MNRLCVRDYTLILATVLVSGCTGQTPNSVRLAQQNELFSSQQQVNTQVDLLWVVDNSASMDTAQDHLRQGFAAFAQKYMQPTWDIRVAVIPTDLYIADSFWSSYLNSTISGTVGWKSPYINGRLASFANPASNPTLVNLSTGKFDNGVKIKDMVPAWNANYAKLLPGIHDGPIQALCFEGLPYFLSGATNCAIRDNQNAYNGPSHCLTPTGGETADTQCVNTVENNTVRSGKAIISTMPPTGTAGDAAWTQSLVNNFMVNLTTGSSGSGSERGFASILQLIKDNEGTATSFFRPGALHGIIIISDENDQTMTLPGSFPAGYTPMTDYMCDQASLVAMNGSSVASPTGTAYCCSGGGCAYGSKGTSCPSKTVDGTSLTISLCPDSAKLIAVSTIKSQLDSFFVALDGSLATGANYFVTSIVPTTLASVNSLQAKRDIDDAAIGQVKTKTVDYDDRYIEMSNLVGNGSSVMDIANSDYSAILDSIGQSIIQKKGTFKLSRLPTNTEFLLVEVVHQDGSKTTIPSAIYTINGQSVTITDLNTVLGLKSTDSILISYEPKTVI